MIEKDDNFRSKEEKSMIKHYKVALLLVTAIFLLGACSASFDKEQKEAQLAVEEAFKEKPKETNHKNKEIKYYLPFGYEIEEETPNNIILKNGSKTYILFYNQHENEKSKVVFNATIKQNDYDVKETFEEDGKFGFYLVKKIDDKMNEVTVGIGGVKVTGEVRTTSLETEAALMMTIANGVKLK
jgi:hypothetical protein